MNAIVIAFVLVIRSASPSRSPARRRRPTPRVRKLSATSQPDARTVPRVRLRTAWGRAALDRAAGAESGERGRREDHDKERRKDPAHRRQHDEDRSPRGLLLGALAALGTERLRLDAQHLGHRDTELVRLDDRGDEALELLHVDALADPAADLLP